MQRTELVFGYEWEETKMSLFQSRLPEGNIQIRYSFLNDEKANYVGTAHRYQEYLVRKYKLSPVRKRENLPFMLEVVTSIHETRPVLGIPKRLAKPVTTFRQAKEIIEDLEQEGVRGIKLRLTGWLAGGRASLFPRSNQARGCSRFKRKNLGTLLTYLNEKDIVLFPDVSFIQYL